MKKPELSHDDRQRVYEELNSLPSWQDGGVMGEKSLLRAAGFPGNLVGQIMLTGNAGIDTPNLISHLEGFGHLTTKPKHTALGALIEHLANTTSRIESKQFLEGLLSRYHLIDGYEASKASDTEDSQLDSPPSSPHSFDQKQEQLS